MHEPDEPPDLESRRAPRSRRGVTQTTVRAGTLEADARMAAATRFGSLGVELADVVALGVGAARSVLDDCGLTVSSVLGVPDLLDDSTGGRRGHKTALEAAAALGAPGAVAGTGPLGERTIVEADGFVRERLMELGRRATELGVRFLLEPMHPIMRGWSYVHSLDHAARIVAGLDGVGLVADLAHLWWDPGLPASLAHHIDLLALVQIADVPADALVGLRYERCPLGAGEVPVAHLIEVCEAAGYTGVYECEVVMRLPRDRRPALLADSISWLDAFGCSIMAP